MSLAPWIRGLRSKSRKTGQKTGGWVVFWRIANEMNRLGPFLNAFCAHLMHFWSISDAYFAMTAGLVRGEIRTAEGCGFPTYSIMRLLHLILRSRQFAQATTISLKSAIPENSSRTIFISAKRTPRSSNSGTLTIILSKKACKVGPRATMASRAAK